VLYLMRLLILGVGVAAIAGTLLAALSPAKQVSRTSEPLPAALAPADRGRGLAAGRLPQQVEDLQLSSELTRFKAQVEQLITLTPGLTPSIFALDLDSGHYLDLQGSQALPAASTIKVPILVAFLQQVDGGTLALNQTLALQETQIASGSGTLANDVIGTEYSALEVASRMIITSDNTATNMIIDALGGTEVLNQKFAEWGLTATVLRNPLPDLDGTNTTSTRDLAMLMALVDQGGLLSPRSRDRLVSIMQRTANRSLIPTGIGDQDGTLVANKTGDIATLLGDVALVDTANGHRYALALLVQRPDNDGRASELIRRLTEITHSEINQPLSPVGRPPDPVAPPLPALDGESPAEGAAPPALESQPVPPANSPGQSGNAVPPG
jgi:beta-lactamase class A